MAPEMESDMMETTTENRRRRGYVKKRVKTARRTTEYPGIWILNFELNNKQEQMKHKNTHIFGYSRVTLINGND